MPVTISYDLRTDQPAVRNYVRSMLERFGWRRLGGSVFRYTGRTIDGQPNQEDWFNDVIPSLMFLRSYVLNQGATFAFFTLDASSITMLDHTDAEALFGEQPKSGDDLELVEPTNQQSAVGTIRTFVNTARDAAD